MWTKALFWLVVAYVAAAAVWVFGAGVVRDRPELLNVACDPTRELWKDLNAAFAQTQNPGLPIRMSHGGSSSQARAVIDGLQADVVTLALWTDTDAIRKAGLIRPGWDAKDASGEDPSLPYVSTIVFVVRKGNPKGIRDWPDLARGDVQIVTPSPKTSGNGKWSFLALWGSVIWRGGSETEAREYVSGVYRRVPILDAAARAATMTFAQKGIGDVHLTWENEAFLEVQESGGELEVIHPTRSVLAEPHIAIVDANVDRKGTRATAQAYLDFLHTEPAQDLIAKHFHRPNSKFVGVRQAVAARHRGVFPVMELRRATTLVPGDQPDGEKWDTIQKTYFAEGAVFDQIMAARET